ncbi:axial regulator YABBY 4 [Cinnamomum micranthum f. kanehirae]|uniref:Axial regulator YABBY 4 n=1 Tax=Cinnamomum micranthum f. kanehirae TaxID=337451 RepID=A0A3S3N1H8_9MAGN|nr:axial regulator YABBY 4 [Cinnamomum micranthum f. kanehirae]
MSIMNHFLDLSEKVSVPCSCLLKTVTVRCGHCSGLLSVNMTKASFVPLHLLTSFEVDKQIQELPVDTPPLMHPIEEDDVDDKDPVPTVVNKPPEKRQRAPSAYNHFIKLEEIRRLKAREPNMTHKEAFSTAAKNWAHFPRVQYKVDGEGCSQGERKENKDGDIDEVDIQTNGLRERKASRQ